MSQMSMLYFTHTNLLVGEFVFNRFLNDPNLQHRCSYCGTLGGLSHTFCYEETGATLNSCGRKECSERTSLLTKEYQTLMQELGCWNKKKTQ